MKIIDYRKLFAAILAFILVLPAFGQKHPSAKQLIADMQEALKSGGAMEFVFTFRAENSAGEKVEETDGSFIAEGECFRMNTTAVEMYCDGVYKWLHDKINQEITIFPHAPNTIEIAENPFSVLSRITPAEFNFRSGVREQNENGILSYTVVISPKDKSLSYSELVLTVRDADRLPSVMEYQSVSGNRYILNITKAESVPAKDAGFFVPSEELLENPDIYITDLR